VLVSLLVYVCVCARARVCVCIYKYRRVSGSITSGVAGDFSEATDGAMCPGVDSASKNEYQETPEDKGGRCVRVTTLQPS
jgi:hypothetical protein